MFAAVAQIKSEAAYRATMKRIDELLPLTGDDVPTDAPNMLEMDMFCDMVEEYEDIHYPIGKTELPDVSQLWHNICFKLQEKMADGGWVARYRERPRQPSFPLPVCKSGQGVSSDAQHGQ